MKRKIIILFVLAAGVLAAAPLWAQDGGEEQRGQGIEISPPIIELEADPGETVVVDINIRNITDVELLTQAAVNDFLAGDETGAPKILFEEDEESPYSLKNYIGQVPDLRIGPRELETVEVTLTIPEDASPGGHYGLVRFIAVPSSTDIDGSAVDLTASIGTLILLNVSGDVQELVQVEQFEPVSIETLELESVRQISGRRFFEYGPVGLVTRLQNSGNVHVQPRGSIKVTNLLGKEVSDVDFNPTSKNVLPASVRRFDHSLDEKWLFGRYTATLELSYGDNDNDLRAVANFWVIPWKIVAGVLLLLVTVVYFGRKALQAYKHNVIKQHQLSSGGDQSPPTS